MGDRLADIIGVAPWGPMDDALQFIHWLAHRDTNIREISSTELKERAERIMAEVEAVPGLRQRMDYVLNGVPVGRGE